MRADSPREIVATSIHRYLVSRLRSVHSEATIGAFAGPPGLGKTTAAVQFETEQGGEVALVTLRFPNTKSVQVLQDVLAAIRRVCGSCETHLPTNRRELQTALGRAIDGWANLMFARRGWDAEAPLTVVFDEAQNLAPEAIETLRFWNDGEGDVRPLGLAFLGNHQFRLESGTSGPSFLSAAVDSRTGYKRTFGYADLSDDDLGLLFGAWGVSEPSALALLLRHCRGADFNRDLRQLSRRFGRLNSAGLTPTETNLRSFLGIE